MKKYYAIFFFAPYKEKALPWRRDVVVKPAIKMQVFRREKALCVFVGMREYHKYTATYT